MSNINKAKRFAKHTAVLLLYVAFIAALFFNHFAATNVTGFSETLSLGKKSLSLAEKILEFSRKILEFREKLLILGNKFGI